MTKEKEYIGVLDVGTSKILAIVGEVKDDGSVDIVRLGEADSHGLKSGMVIDIEAVARSVQKAVMTATEAEIRLSRVTVGITGNHIRSFNSPGVVKVKDKDEIAEEDVRRAIDTARAINIPLDHSIIYHEVQEYLIDNQQGVRHPVGMSGIRLDTRVHIITGMTTALQNIQKCVSRCGLEIDFTAVNPLASGKAVLSKDDKDLGVCLIDMGHGTTDIAVYIDGAIHHTAVIPMAGDTINKHISRALNTHYSTAEFLKTSHGGVLLYEDDKEKFVEVASLGEQAPRETSLYTLNTVISATVKEILEVVQAELEKANIPKDKLVSGIVITGGSAQLSGIAAFAEEVFDLPARIGIPQEQDGVYEERIRNPRYSTVLGLWKSAVERIPAATFAGSRLSEAKKTAREGGWWQKAVTWFKTNL